MIGRETVTFVLILLAGMIAGSILGDILGEWLPFLRVSKTVSWSPSLDLDILTFKLSLQLKFNLASIAGLAFAFWISRRVR
ncbi:DUF4321 domain-containing protein [Brevibacillus fluminis]|uniref:DUF4321 domain-containing protein n=2 Tax=Brevibacillus fluminis TaxID=511487 RepID=A0A3M8DR16_9BACL|nr:DUF4321 domain-containing protein [Brevibacillus fluminis]RNB90568.1 DUF4321 domain-containing protein [Brevibacillus fluminis]